MEFIGTIEQALGKTAEKNMLPIQPGDVESTYADTTELNEMFHYKPFTPLERGVSEFVKWYRTFYCMEGGEK
jgi:UDP-glucuronate 4-epimerase